MVDAEQLKGLSAEQLREVVLGIVVLLPFCGAESYLQIVTAQEARRTAFAKHRAILAKNSGGGLVRMSPVVQPQGFTPGDNQAAGSQAC
jgi:hypothetical protein